jgi:uncharacterized protein (DUF58 family)
MSEQAQSASSLPPAVVEWLERWINVHRVLWVLCLVCFFVAWNRGLALMYGVFSLGLALLLISHLMPRWQLHGLRMVRGLSGDLTAGQVGTLSYRLLSSGRRYHVSVRERLPFAEGEHRLFFSTSGDNAVEHLSVQCERRGAYRLREITLSSAYPFGIVTCSRKISTPILEVVVLPRIYELSGLPDPVVADANREGDVSVPQQGGHGQFAAVREYMQGDELRAIHWRASARLQQWVVKEYERTDRPVLLVVLDCRQMFLRGEGARSTFEDAISIAASMIHFASRDGMQSLLVAEDGQWHEKTIPAYSSDLYDLYEFLARLEPTGEQCCARVIEQAVARFPQANLVTGFRLQGDPDLPQLPVNLTHVDIEMDGESYLFPLRDRAHWRTRRDGNRLTYRVDAMTRLENLFQ